MLTEETREYKLAKAIENAVNDYGFNRDNFIAGVSTMHRTLQQSLFRQIVLPIISHFASESFGTDDRNRRAHEIAKYIEFSLDGVNTYLPHI